MPKKTARNLKFLALSLTVLIAGVVVAAGLPRTVSLAQTMVFSENGPAKAVILEDNQRVAGVSKIIAQPKSAGIPAPVLTAAGALVQDLDSGVILYQKNPNSRLPIASTTKIMTALIGVGFYKPNSVLTVSQDALVGGSVMGLKLGEQLSFRSVLYGMLLNSGNDAAFTIAANYPGGIPAFVAAMNLKAQELGLQNTHFQNPAGFDSPDHYSSAADLAKIAVVAEGDPQIARVVSTKATEVASLDKTVLHNLHNLNVLLDIPGVIGMKTGFTPLAKENLVGIMEKNDHRIVTIVLGSDDRFGESKQLMDWTWQNYSWVTP